MFQKGLPTQVFGGENRRRLIAVSDETKRSLSTSKRLTFWTYEEVTVQLERNGLNDGRREYVFNIEFLHIYLFFFYNA